MAVNANANEALASQCGPLVARTIFMIKIQS